jgi:catechol 2,3-dioxygenase-like lactoylglutathione lyase family enzyme
MVYRAVTHIAIHIAPLREAEAYYRSLFGLQVAFREAEVNGVWRTLPDTAGWEEAAASGIKLGLSVLGRDSFVLALSAGTDAAAGGRLDHIGLLVDETGLIELRQRAQGLNCRSLTDRSACSKTLTV